MFRRAIEYFYKIIFPLLIASILYMSLLHSVVPLPARLSTFALKATRPTSIIKTLALTHSCKISSTKTMEVPDTPQTGASTPLPKLSSTELRQYNRLADSEYH
jgi:hypothetical protein